MDYVDFVVHIFLTEKRAYYDIERLRKSARTVDLDQLKTMLVEKTAVARAKPAKKADQKSRGQEETKQSSRVRRKSAASKADKALKPLSNAHRHDHVTILEVIRGIFRAHLTGRLSVFKFKPDFAAGADSPEKVDQIGRIETDHDGVEAVGSFDRVFRLARFRRGGRDLHLVLFQPDLDRARSVRRRIARLVWIDPINSSLRTTTNLLLSRGSTAS